MYIECIYKIVQNIIYNYQIPLFLNVEYYETQEMFE